MKPPRSVFSPLLDTGSLSPAGSASGRKMNIKRRKKGNRKPFLWMLITTLNLFLVVSAWVGVSTILSQPERPICYKILGILGKQPELKAIERSELGSALTKLNSTQIEQKYGKLNYLQLEELNAQLLRAYLTNYRRTQEAPMLDGEFELISARPLQKTDFIESGIVLLARSTTAHQSSVYLEYILPSIAEKTPALEELSLNLHAGSTQPILKLKATKQLAALTHVSYLENSDILLSAVPLSYQSPRFAKGASIELSAPESINIERSLPILKTQDIDVGRNLELTQNELASLMNLSQNMQ